MQAKATVPEGLGCDTGCTPLCTREQVVWSGVLEPQVTVSIGEEGS